MPRGSCVPPLRVFMAAFAAAAALAGGSQMGMPCRGEQRESACFVVSARVCLGGRVKAEQFSTFSRCVSHRCGHWPCTRSVLGLVVLIVSRHDETVEMDCSWLDDGATLLLNQVAPELQRPLAARAYAVSKDSGHAIIMRLTAVSQGRSVPSKYSPGAHSRAFGPTMRSGR